MSPSTDRSTVGRVEPIPTFLPVVKIPASAPSETAQVPPAPGRDPLAPWRPWKPAPVSP